MSATGLEVFDDTIQKTHIFLKEIMEETGPDRRRAYDILRAVLHTLRDRLTVDQAAHLGAQLPMLVRGLYYEGWRPARTPEKLRSSDAFLQKVGEQLQFVPPINVEQAARSVFRVLTDHVSPGEVRQVRDNLPAHIRKLWP